MEIEQCLKSVVDFENELHLTYFELGGISVSAYWEQKRWDLSMQQDEHEIKILMINH